MDIVRFIEVCDGVIARQDALQRLSSKEAYEALQQAAVGVTKDVLSAVTALRKHLAIRVECGAIKKNPYLSILAVIRDAVRGADTPHEEADINWERLVELVLSARTSLHWFREGSAEKFTDQENALALACLRLSRLGVVICEDDMAVKISSDSHALIQAEISQMASAVGGMKLLELVFASLESSYYQPFGRYLFGRKVSTGFTTIFPVVPWGYLIALGIKHLTDKQQADNEQKFYQLVSFLRDLITVFEIQPYSMWSGLFLDEQCFLPSLQETVLYDNLVAVQQLSGRHAKLILTLLTKPFIADKHESYGVRLKDALKVALAAIDLAPAKKMSKVSLEKISRQAGLRKDLVSSVLSKILAFPERASNRELNFPPSSERVDSNFKPLFWYRDGYLMLPRPVTALAAMNAILNMISRPNDVHDSELDKSLGEVLEGFIRAQLQASGVPVYTGDIQSDGRDTLGECDALIETPKGLFIFEVKKKGLTRRAMTGEGAQLLVDLGHSLMKAHEQAYKAETHLRKTGRLMLKNKQNEEVTIELGGREIEKASISLTDFGGFQSRSILQAILTTAIDLDYKVADEKEDKRLEDWRKSVKALRQYVIDEQPERAFWNSSFLSVPQILTMLERVKSADDFFEEATRGRRMLYGLQDFYSEYVQALKMAKLKHSLSIE